MDSVLLVQRNTPPDGSLTQTVDVLANHGTDWYLWSVRNVDITLTDTQVQAYLDSIVADVIQEILANNEVPLTAEQLSNYQNVIDLHQLQIWLDTLKTDIDLINTATTDPNAPAGWKEAFRSSNYTPLSNATKFVLIGSGLFSICQILSDMIKAERIMLKRDKRAVDSGNFSALAK